jgi:uncharacterized membrane protein
MAELPFILATLGALALVVVCLVQAWREGPRFVMIIVCGALFGMLVEYLDMRFMSSYHYGHFPCMLLGTVPLMIVMSWGAIIYGVMRTSDRLKLRWYLRPINDAFLALTIDLSLDPVAIRMGYWTWTIKGQKEPPWFGVPFANYYGWFVVVLSFSLVLRIGFQLFPSNLHKWSALAVPLATILLAMGPFYGLLIVYGLAIKFAPEPIAFSILMGFYYLILLRYLLILPHDAPLDKVSLAIPVFFHCFTVFLLFAWRLWQQSPALVILVPTIAIFSLICYAWPYLDTLKARLDRLPLSEISLPLGGQGREPDPPLPNDPFAP